MQIGVLLQLPDDQSNLIFLYRWLLDEVPVKGQTKHYLDIPNLDHSYYRSILKCRGTNAIGYTDTSTVLDIECKYS